MHISSIAFGVQSLGSTHSQIICPLLTAVSCNRQCGIHSKSTVSSGSTYTRWGNHHQICKNDQPASYSLTGIRFVPIRTCFIVFQITLIVSFRDILDSVSRPAGGFQEFFLPLLSISILSLLTKTPLSKFDALRPEHWQVKKKPLPHPDSSSVRSDKFFPFPWILSDKKLWLFPSELAKGGSLSFVERCFSACDSGRGIAVNSEMQRLHSLCDWRRKCTPGSICGHREVGGFEWIFIGNDKVVIGWWSQRAERTLHRGGRRWDSCEMEFDGWMDSQKAMTTLVFAWIILKLVKYLNDCQMFSMWCTFSGYLPQSPRSNYRRSCRSFPKNFIYWEMKSMSQISWPWCKRS
jgi:hypothetical protein